MGEVEEGEGEDTLWEYDDIGMVAISEGLKNLNRFFWASHNDGALIMVTMNWTKPPNTLSIRQ